MSVGRLCAREVDLAEVDENVWAVAERMHGRGVGSLVIVNDAQQPIGMLTDRDLVQRVLAQRLDSNSATVGDVMTPAPKTICEDDSIEAALSLMRSGCFRRLPVVDRDGKLTGILSLDDVLILLAEEFGQIGELLRRETPRGVAERMAGAR